MKLVKSNNAYNKIKISELIEINKENIGRSVDEIKYLDISSVNNGTISGYKYIEGRENFPSRAKRIARNGDSVFSTVRPNLKGFSMIKDDNVVASTGFAVVSPKDKAFSDFIYFILSSDKYIKKMISVCGGGNYPAFKASDILEFEIPSFNSKDMSLIGLTLKKQYDKLSKLKALIDSLETRNTYLADKLLSGEIRLRENEVGEIERYENTDFKEIELNGRIKKIPNDWTTFNVGDSLISLGKSKHKAKSSSENGQYPFFNCSENINLSHDEYIFDGEAVLLSTGGKPAVHFYNGKLNYTTDVFAVQFNDKDNQYLSSWLKSNLATIARCFQGTGLKHLSKKLFNKVDISYPSQDKEVMLINKFINNMNKQKESYKELLHLEEQRFEWLSESLLSGEYQLVD